LLITVFTPTYNRADKLHRVYNSLKNQTLKKIDNKPIFEWLIIDDGSEDNTKELIKKWQKEADFLIRYFYQENKGKTKAMIKSIELTENELFLILDSDDECLPETIEFFYNQWNKFSKEDKSLCASITVLCQDQFGNRIGCNYPKYNQKVNILEAVIKWKKYPLGETWSILKTANLKRAFKLPKEAKNLKFIPESFFWDRIAFENPGQFYYPINKVLRIYYKEEGNNLSKNIRNKYPDGFLFESKWVVKNYYKFALKYPRYYLKHLLKLIYFSFKVKK